MTNPNAPASVTDACCLDLLSDALDGNDAVRIDLILRLCLLESDASRRAGAIRLAETAEPVRVYLA